MIFENMSKRELKSELKRINERLSYLKIESSPNRINNFKIFDEVIKMLEDDKIEIEKRLNDK